MGAEASRNANLPKDINCTKIRTKIINSWTEENILAFEFTAEQSSPTPTLKVSTIKKGGQFIKEYFQSHPIDGGLRVLDVFSGNCHASFIIHNVLTDLVSSWTCTDIIDFKSKPDFPASMK